VFNAAENERKNSITEYVEFMNVIKFPLPLPNNIERREMCRSRYVRVS